MAYTDYLETVEQAYIAFYQRPADPEGLLFWAKKLDENDGALDAMLEAFADSEEAQELYGDITEDNIEDVVNEIYQAAFNRQPDESGLQYYSEGFKNGEFSQASILLDVINGAQNEDALTLQNKTQSALNYTKSFDPDLDGEQIQGSFTSQEAKTFLADVNADPSTIKDPMNQDQAPSHGANAPWMQDEAPESESDNSVDDADAATEETASEDESLSESLPETSDGTDTETPDETADENTTDESTVDETATVETTALYSESEIDSLVYMYQEEKLAGDVYTLLADAYDAKIFSNIAVAEETHQASVATLLEDADYDMSNLEALAPGEFADTDLQALYDDLVEQGLASLEEAVAVGIAVEETDIEDLETYEESETLDPAIQTVYDHLLEGSQKHLDAFESYLA